MNYSLILYFRHSQGDRFMTSSETSDTNRNEARRNMAAAIARTTQKPIHAYVALASNLPFTDAEQQILVDCIATDPRFVPMTLKRVTHLTLAQHAQLEKLLS